MKLINIEKKYYLKNKNTFTLKDINLSFEKGKFYGIIGHSGSGKTTLINIIGLIDNFDSGKYIIDDMEITKLNEDKKAELRLKKFGFVFQTFYLEPNLTTLENVMLPMIINTNITKKERKKKAIEILNMLDLKNKINHLPKHLSGGEQQRVAIARALANNPEIIIADEPTGNLDKENEKIVFNILKNLCKNKNKTIIVVTHNNDIIRKYADFIYKIESGNITMEDH